MSQKFYSFFGYTLTKGNVTYAVENPPNRIFHIFGWSIFKWK